MERFVNNILSRSGPTNGASSAFSTLPRINSGNVVQGGEADTPASFRTGATPTQLGRSSGSPSASAKGHEDAFPRPRLSARSQFSQATFAGPRGNGRDAPIPDLPALVRPGRSGGPRNSV